MDEKLINLCKKYEDALDDWYNSDKFDEVKSELLDHISDHYKVTLNATIENVVDTLYIDLDDIANDPKDIKGIIKDAVRELSIDDLFDVLNIKVVYE